MPLQLDCQSLKFRYDICFTDFPCVIWIMLCSINITTILFFNRSGFKIDELAISRVRNHPERSPNPPQNTCISSSPTLQLPVRPSCIWLLPSLLLPACHPRQATLLQVYLSPPGSRPSCPCPHRHHLSPPTKLHPAPCMEQVSQELPKTITTKPQTSDTATKCFHTASSVIGS